MRKTNAPQAGGNGRDERADDLLWGAQAIADELRLPVHKVHYLIRMNRIPVVHLGPKTIIASRKKLWAALT